MKRFLCGSALAAALALPTVARAESPNTGAMHFSGGIDFTTSYFFRGYNQEDTGVIGQPYITVSVDVLDSDDLDISAYLGTWNSVHSATATDTWYESDVYGGVDFAFGNFVAGVVYTFYNYPDNAAGPIEEIGFRLGFDDAQMMKDAGLPFGLNPYVAYYIETKDAGGTEDQYLEVGITPSFELGVAEITLSIPMVLGMSVDDYYTDSSGDNELLGYGSVGVFASLPLALPERYGSWSLTGGIQYIQICADSAQAANDGGETYELLGKLGLAWSY
jgi:uncharacterized protein (TIGR02001 family)